MFYVTNSLCGLREAVSEFIPTYPNVCIIYALNPESATRLTVPLCIVLLESLLAFGGVVLELKMVFESICISYVDHTNIMKKRCQPFL